MKTKTIRAYHFTGEKLRCGSPLPAKRDLAVYLASLPANLTA
jgi:hypothetical protein